MGRTIPSATQVFMKEEQAFGRFRRALRRADQDALDDLFAAAQKHLAVVAYASHALPFETMLLAMLLEEHKLVMQLRGMLGSLLDLLPKDKPRLDIPPSQLELKLEAHKEETHSEDVIEKVHYVPVEESS
jgi:hypothetical protein